MSENWKSSNWDALVHGENCPICITIQSGIEEEPGKIAIFDLGISKLFLIKNQYVPGYCVLLCNRHIIEPHELTNSERAQFFNDMASAGKALQQAFNADKMNYNILGNVVPHLHAHIIPRYFTDSSPNRPIDPTPKGQEVYLSASEYIERITVIRQALRAH
jgi:diadenosine tetraphosphate (Ap4A) HIT family hydrolase